jgi:hypothetical protein
LPEQKILVWESLFLSFPQEKYDSDKEEFVDLGADSHSFTSYTMLGYGIVDNLELLVQLPVHWKTQEPDESVGIGDVSIQPRLLLYKGEGAYPSVNLGVMLRFPTGDEHEKPSLGDGTLDLGFSTVITEKIGFFVGHLKFGYIFNGRKPDEVNLGDKVMYMVKADFIVVAGDYPAMKQLALMLGFCGNWKFDDRSVDGDRVKHTHQYRPLQIAPMIRWTFAKGMFIRPKVVVPIKALATGGKYFPVQYVLDASFTF